MLDDVKIDGIPSPSPSDGPGYTCSVYVTVTHCTLSSSLVAKHVAQLVKAP